MKKDESELRFQKEKFQLRRREHWQRVEKHWLAPYACQSHNADETRRHAEEPHSYRTSFQRDRDRIVHSRAFRRLKHKRQVFMTTEGDHFRTRMTHTLEVAQISRTMARALGLNEDLVEAVALGHDLGHTPFGHLGETILNEIMQGKETLDGTLDHRFKGGFKHNYQSLRIVDLLEEKYERSGLNLTASVREGILKHTRLKRSQYRYPSLFTQDLSFDCDYASTLEGQVVTIADEVAQRTHDFEDGLRAELVTLEDIQELEIVQLVNQRYNLSHLQKENRYLYRNRLINSLINLLVNDIIKNTLHNIERFEQKKNRLDDFDEAIVCFSKTIDPLQNQLNKFIYQRIIFVPDTQQSDEDARQVLHSLFRHYFQNPRLLPHNTHFFANFQAYDDPTELPRRITDFIAGMTDHFAIAEFRRLKDMGIPLPQVNLTKLSIGRNNKPFKKLQ